MIFEIEYKEAPIKKVEFYSDGFAPCIVEIGKFPHGNIRLTIDTGGNSSAFATFSPQSAIELVEMLIKLGKQDLEDNTNERL